MTPYEARLADAIYATETIRLGSNVPRRPPSESANAMLDFILANTLIANVNDKLLDAIERVASPHEASLPGLATFRERRAAKKAAQLTERKDA